MKVKRLGTQMQGDLGEKLRAAKHRGKAFNLNRLTGGENAPLCDLATEKGFESVKVYGNVKRIVGHLCDVQASDEWTSSRQRGLNSKTAQLLREKAGQLRAAKAWPKGLSARSSEKAIMQHLREKMIIAVPDDMVRSSQRYLLRHIKANAPLYGVDGNDRKAILSRYLSLKDRIQGIGTRYETIVNNAAQKTARAHLHLRLSNPASSFTRGRPVATPPASNSAKPAPAPPVSPNAVITPSPPPVPSAMKGR